MKTVKETKECPILRRAARTKKVTPKTLSSGPVCLLCLQEPGDPEKLGDFLQKDSLCVHYFCLVSIKAFSALCVLQLLLDKYFCV